MVCLPGNTNEMKRWNHRVAVFAHDFEKNSQASYWTKYAKDTYWDIMAVVEKVAMTNGKQFYLIVILFQFIISLILYIAMYY